MKWERTRARQGNYFAADTMAGDAVDYRATYEEAIIIAR
jgi:hypothetical protein